MVADSCEPCKEEGRATLVVMETGPISFLVCVCYPVLCVGTGSMRWWRSLRRLRTLKRRRSISATYDWYIRDVCILDIYVSVFVGMRVAV
jgi:hypothetical protein